MARQASFDRETESDTTIVCPLERAIRTIGGRWKMLVLRSLFVSGAQRYNALLRTVPDISAKELTRNLRELEHAGLIEKTKGENASADIAVYALTALGERLQPAFKALGAFGELLAGKR
jgi:DNA-binding HxlR family transcriptional regulator